VNNTDNNRTEDTHKYSTICIGTITVIARVIEMINGYEIMDFEEIIYADHRGFIIGLN